MRDSSTRKLMGIMRYEYKAALAGGIPLGLVMLCFLLMVSPSRKWDLLFFSLAGIIGALLSYLYYKTSQTHGSLKRGTIIGASAGLAAAVFYYFTGAALFLVFANSKVVFNTQSMIWTVIGAVLLTLASGLGGLAAGFLVKLKKASWTAQKH